MTSVDLTGGPREVVMETSAELVRLRLLNRELAVALREVLFQYEIQIGPKGNWRTKMAHEVLAKVPR